MSRTYHHGHHQPSERIVRVRGVRREPPDLRGMARLLIALAQTAQDEADAEATHRHSRIAKKKPKRPKRNNATNGDAA